MLQAALFTPAVPTSTAIGAKFKLAVAHLSNNTPFAYKFLNPPLFFFSSPTNDGQQREAEKQTCSAMDCDHAVKHQRESPFVTCCHLCSHQAERTVGRFSFENSQAV